MQVNMPTLYIGVILIAAAILTLLISKKGDTINPVAGYRTPWSMKSRETWVAANRYSGKALLTTGIMTVACGFVVWLKPLAPYGLLITTSIMTVGIVITIVATESYLRRSFNEDGTVKDVTARAPEPAATAQPARPSSTLPDRLPFSALDYFLEIGALLGIILGLAAVIIYYPDLPARVPQHYGAGGKVDAWGGKGLVFMLPVISLVLYSLMSMIRWFSPSASGKKTSPRQWRLSLDMINWLKALTVWTFTYLSWMTLQIALGHARSLHTVFNPLMLTSMTALISFYTWRILRAGNS